MLQRALITASKRSVGPVKIPCLAVFFSCCVAAGKQVEQTNRMLLRPTVERFMVILINTAFAPCARNWAHVRCVRKRSAVNMILGKARARICASLTQRSERGGLIFTRRRGFKLKFVFDGPAAAAAVAAAAASMVACCIGFFVLFSPSRYSRHGCSCVRTCVCVRAHNVTE